MDFRKERICILSNFKKEGDNMKNLKLLVFGMLVMFIPLVTVNAQEVTGPKPKSLKQCLNGTDTVCTLTSDVKVTGSSDISVTRDVTIDLNSHTLTLTNDNELWVEDGGSLVIKNGTLVQESNGYSAIVVIYGNVTTSNLTINVTADKDEDDSIPSAFFLQGENNKKGASLVVSADTKVIVPNGNGIEIPDGGLPINATLSGDWDVKNSIVMGTDVTSFTKSTITFDGGSYVSEGVTLPIFKRGTWVINDGTFKSKTDNVFNITVPTNLENLKLSINNGVFETEGEGKKTINDNTLTKFVFGGTFIANKVEDELDTSYIADGYESFVTENNETIVGKRYNIDVKTTENGETTVESNTAISGQYVTLTITPEENYEIDTILVIDNTGKEIEEIDNKFKMPESDVIVKVTFKEKTADYSELDKLIEEAEKIDKKEYTEESYKKLEETLKIAKELSRELKVSDQKSIDDIAKNLKTSIAALEKITVNNPQTGDNILTYVFVGLISIITLGFGVKKLSKNN